MTGFESMLLVWSPCLLFGILFLASFLREPRRFGNAILLLAFLVTLCGLLLLRFGTWWMLLPLLVVLVTMPVVTVVFLVVNGVVVIRREGASPSTLLPLLLAVAILAYLALMPLVMLMRAPDWVVDVVMLVMAEGTWAVVSFVALLLYSWLYRMLPRRRRYDYIIIHGAGLDGDRPTPLLRGRIDRAVELWERQGRRPLLVVSGGRGPDERVSEAEAMRRYLVNDRHVPPESILLEDRSTTTWENLARSKRLMDRRSGEGRYRAALVTSDYHVFRACEYARRLAVPADGVGSHTSGYYWPAAFIREFVAITRSHPWPYVAIAAVWALWTVLATVLPRVLPVLT